MDIPLYFLFSFSLILFSAFLSGAKKAFFVLDRSDVRSLIDEEEHFAVRFLAQRPQKVLLTLLILHQLIWIFLVFKTVWTFHELWERCFSLLILFVVYLWFGRTLPRVLVQGRELRYIQRAARLLKILFFLVSPVRIILEKVSSVLSREGGITENPVIHDKDFNSIVPELEDVSEMYEREMIQNVIDFRETLVKEVMTPRPDMFCVDVKEDVPTVIQKVKSAGFSRIPVYEGDKDHIVGVLYAKDLLPLYLQGASGGQRLAGDFLHSAMHVPETKRVSELLRDFKKQNIHIAMVVDEYGGVEGLVCLEDLLEEIVGEIQDEVDEEEKLVECINERTYRISAMLSLEDFDDLFDVPIESEDYETIGGFVVDHLGHFPKWGEKIIIGGLEISVYRVKDIRVLELLVTRI